MMISDDYDDVNVIRISHKSSFSLIWFRVDTTGCYSCLNPFVPSGPFG